MNLDLSKNLSRSWPPLKGLVTQSLGTSVRPPGDTFGPRRQFSWEFVWVNEGSIQCAIGRKIIQGNEGTLLLVPPGVTDRYKFGGKTRHVHSFIHFSFEAPGPPWPPPRQWPLKRALRPGHPLLELFRIILSTNYGGAEKWSPLLAPALDLMVRLFVLEAPPRRRLYDPGMPAAVEKALVWMNRLVETDPGTRPALGDLARHCFVSPQHLSRLFKRHLGFGPMKCLWFLRARRAGSQLEQSVLSLKEVAVQAGFENGFHFSRVFKQLYGIAPSLYRERFREGKEFRLDLPIFRSHPWSGSVINSDLGPSPVAIRRVKRRS